MYQKQIYLNRFFTRKNLILIFGSILIYLVISLFINQKVFACGTTGNPGNFLSGYDSNGFGGNNCGNGDTLHLNASGFSSYNSGNNTYNITQGSSINISLGYQSANGSGGNDVYTWIQMYDASNELTTASLNPNAGNGFSVPYCYSMALPSGPYQNQNGWPFAGQGGKIGCNGETICYFYVPPGVNCPPPDPSGKILYPQPPGGVYAGGQQGYSVIYREPASNASGNHRYTLTINPTGTGEFCFREHVSLSSAGFHSGNVNDTNYATYLSGTLLAPDVAAMYDGVPGSAGDVCVNVIPIQAQSQADCTIIALSTLPANEQWLVHVQGWNINNSTGAVDQPADIQIPSGNSNPSSSSPTTSGYTGDGTAIGGDKRASNDWNGTSMYVVDHNGDAGTRFNVSSVYVEITKVIRKHSSGVWTTISYSDQLLPCYGPNVTCSVSVSGDGPNNQVVSGGTIHVNVTISNNGSADLPQNINGYILQFSNGDSNGNGGNVGGFSEWPPPGDGPILHGTSRQIPFDLTAPNSTNPQVLSLVGHVTYSGLFNFGPGGACSTNIDVYAPFTLTPVAPGPNLSPTPEAPTDVINNTWVTENGPTVSEHVTSYVSKATANCGSNTVNTTFSNGPFSNGNTYKLFNNYDYGACTPVTVGDSYCAEAYVPITSLPGNTAYVDVNGNIIGGGPKEDKNCTPVTNRPIFKVYDGGVEAGGAFSSDSGGTCSSTNTGTLASWNNNTGNYPTLNNFGAGSSLGALAQGTISGFASAQLPKFNTAYGNSTYGNWQTAYYTSFANQPPSNPWNVSTTQDNSAPDLGGNFGSSYCLTDETPPQSNPNSIHETGDYTINPGDPIFNPTTNEIDKNISLFVDGNVYINTDINYSLTGWSTDNVPSFILHAGGSIYISPSVKELDGIYIAKGGNIYTCGLSNYTNMDHSNLFSQCRQQLVVYGAFIAKQIDLERTFGTLRNETPVKNNSPVEVGLDSPVKLDEFACHDPGSSPPYTQPHYYQVEGSSNSFDTFSETPAPNNQNCDKAQPTTNDGYVFSANDTVFKDYIKKAKITDANHLVLICEKSQNGNRGNNNQLYTQGITSANIDTANCNANPFGINNGTPLGYALPNSTPTIGNVVEPLFSNNDGFCFNKTDFDYYSTTNNAEPDDTFNFSTLGCDYNAPKTSVAYVLSDANFSIPIYATPTYLPNNTPACDNNGGTANIIYPTCAAEVFYYSPEMYLSSPAVEKPSNDTLEVNSISTLPPIL